MGVTTSQYFSGDGFRLIRRNEGGAGHTLPQNKQKASWTAKNTMARTQVITALLLGVAVQLASSRGLFYYREDDEFAGNSSCSGTPNLNRPWIGQPTFVRQIENGTLYTAGDGEDMIYGTYANTHILY